MCSEHTNLSWDNLIELIMLSNNQDQLQSPRSDKSGSQQPVSCAISAISKVDNFSMYSKWTKFHELDGQVKLLGGHSTVPNSIKKSPNPLEMSKMPPKRICFHFSWAEAHGPGPMGPGPWPMAHGPWAQGPWPMAHGPWPMANGPGPNAQI